MKALLRPAFVLGLSIAIAATSLIGSSSVALAASRPLMTAPTLNGPVYEGDRPTLSATFTDVDLTDLHTVDVSWGDDTFDQYTLPVGARSFSVQKTVAYANDTTSDLLIFVTLSDPIFSNSKTLGVTVLNAAPSITSFGLSATAVEAGQAVTATGAFTDGGTADTHTVTINWGDGSPTTTATGNPFTSAPHTYASAGNFTVTATVADNAGATATATSTVDVTAPNQAPSVVSFGVTAGNEGGNSTLALTFADADALDTHTVSVVWGDGSASGPADLAAGVTTFDATHVYADTGNYSVVLTLTDSASHTVTASASVSPANVGPVVGSLSLSPSSVVDGQLLTLSGTFTDPGTAGTFTLTVNWGDGSSTEQSLGTARSFSATHTYAAAGPVTISATVADRDNATSSSSVDLVVQSSNHAPAGLALEASASGANVAVNVSFTDADADDTHSLTVSWGDGATTSQFLAAGTTTYTLSHVYAATNTYSVTATVTDPDGASASGTTQVSVTAASGSAANVVDEMVTLVQSFGLDWQNERWLVRKLGDLKNSLVYGNAQVCSGTGQLSHILAFAQRNLTGAQYAELSESANRLRAAAGCSATATQLPKAVKTATVTTAVTSAPTTQKKDATAKDEKKAAKADSKLAAGRGSSH
jgi:PKD repeat protein